MSSDIHSGVSGTVSEITTSSPPPTARPRPLWSSYPTASRRWTPPSPPEVTDYKSFVDAIRASGLVAWRRWLPHGGEAVPKNLDEIDTLLINGAECEPYITSDNPASS